MLLCHNLKGKFYCDDVYVFNFIITIMPVHQLYKYVISIVLVQLFTFD